MRYTKISKHITFQQAVFSRTALRFGIPNNPSKRQLDVMRYLGSEFFDKLIDSYDGRIAINSFYRSIALNKKIGGATKSDHMILADVAAIDMDAEDNTKLFWFILENFKFNKLIAEFPIGGKPSWVHVSFSSNEAKNEERKVYIAVKNKNSTVYINYNDNTHLLKAKEIVNV